MKPGPTKVGLSDFSYFPDFIFPLLLNSDILIFFLNLSEEICNLQLLICIFPLNVRKKMEFYQYLLDEELILILKLSVEGGSITQTVEQICLYVPSRIQTSPVFFT